jgi:4-amino-4-deoxy-L-arabinose transferase-like glycosyltransferase
MSSQWLVMLIYALIPTSLMYTSVTLREPFQLLFVNLALYASLKIYFHRSNAHWLVLFLAAVGMGVLHGALLATAIFIIAGTLFLLTSRNRKGVSFTKVVLVSPVVILCLFYGFLLFMNLSSYGERMEGGLDYAVQKYQEGTLTAEQRAGYRTEIEINGLGELIISIPSFLFQYLFEPMPWKISSIVDVVVLLENMLRFWLIWNALKYLVGSYLNKPMFVAHNYFGYERFILFMFLSYLVIETLWSLGTSNWGTATRHHVPSLGLLLVASFAYRNVISPKYSRSHKS